MCAPADPPKQYLPSVPGQCLSPIPQRLIRLYQPKLNVNGVDTFSCARAHVVMMSVCVFAATDDRLEHAESESAHFPITFDSICARSQIAVVRTVCLRID